jgi:serine/threonine-protein kinase HipA
MRMAQLVGVEIPPCGLLRLADDSLAFVIKRFDRPDAGGKLAVEDFCQLSGQPLRGKYDGSAEGCIKVVRKYVTEPLIEVQKLYRLFLFSWWVANGDLHLKNLSLLTTADRIHRLSPAYDLVCTRLVIPDDVLSLPIGGRTKGLTRRHWLDFAEYCRIPERAARRLLAQQIEAFDDAAELVGRSFLTDTVKDQYLAILQQNTSILAA